MPKAKNKTTDKASISVPEMFTETGKSGLNQYDGIINEEQNKLLKGSKAITTYNQMRKEDPIIGAILLLIKCLCLQVNWNLEASENDKGEEAKDFVEKCLSEIYFKSFLSDILTMLPFGFALFEIVYKETEEGMIGWNKFAFRSQDTVYKWDLDDNGNIKGFWQVAPPSYAQIYIQIEKLIHFRITQEKNNPQPDGMLRNAFRPWYFKKKIENFEGIGIERDLAGLPLMYVPAEIMAKGATPELQSQYDYCKKIINNIRNDEQAGIILPAITDEFGKRLYEFQLINSGGKKQVDTDIAIRRKNMEIATAMLADFILLGHDKVGSFALSSDKTDYFSLSLAAILDIITETLQTQAIKPLLLLNGMDIDAMPKLTHGDIETPDLDKLSNYVQRLSLAGYLTPGDEGIEKFLRQAAGLPETVIPASE